ncbi:MAG: BlaI/MecI/CopY family transcriptional regulator [Cyclobacteriaceae bacterium]|nr:BlaI/MecI/CopY family transcriptional regulator [Cyclobacteriaceae bacterium]
MKDLTKAEEQVMKVLWELDQAFVKEIIDRLPPPKPAYNTVSTIVRILEKKGFVGHHAYGKTHQYHPLISKSAYSSYCLKKLLGNYFGGSFEELVSFFAKEQDMDIAELEALLKQVTKDIKPSHD